MPRVACCDIIHARWPSFILQLYCNVDQPSHICRRYYTSVSVHTFKVHVAVRYVIVSLCEWRGKKVGKVYRGRGTFFASDESVVNLERY